MKPCSGGEKSLAGKGEWTGRRATRGRLLGSGAQAVCRPEARMGGPGARTLNQILGPSLLPPCWVKFLKYCLSSHNLEVKDVSGLFHHLSYHSYWAEVKKNHLLWVLG